MIGLAAAFVVFVALAFSANGIARRALLSLSSEEKSRLVGLAAAASPIWSLLTAALFGLWIAVLYFQRQYFIHVTLGVLFGIVVLASVSAVAAFGRLRQAGMPAEFLKSFWVGRCLRLAGTLVFFGAVAAYLLKAS
jgi:hypothetical protein